jgi:diaminopimelate decarboxylase
LRNWRHCYSRYFTCQADIAPGDLIAIPATGAYGRSMASNYNHVPRPPVIAVIDGKARVIVRRENEADLLALDVKE